MRKKSITDWVEVVMVDSKGRRFKRRMPRALAKKMSRDDFKPGVVDGVAGAWTSPRYIKRSSIDYRPGTAQYFNKTINRIKNSYENYKMELESAHE